MRMTFGQGFDSPHLHQIADIIRVSLRLSSRYQNCYNRSDPNDIGLFIQA